jgi:hypothetical protein
MDEIQQHFTSALFRPPATREHIATVESRLGVSVPDVLRRMYLGYDGFRESLGNAQYLFPLEDTHGGGSSLLAINRFYWNEWDLVDLRPFLFFGLSTSDQCWGMNLATGSEIIHYHHSMGAEYELAGTSILEVYVADEQWMLEVVADSDA